MSLIPVAIRTRVFVLISGLAVALAPLTGGAQPRATDAHLEATRSQWEAVAQRIWETPELALQEVKSSAELARELEREGFEVVWGSGGMPTAFIATAGSGGPTIGFLAEYDALPGLSQAAGTAKREPLVADGPGHACGHNLLGTASVAAAVAANRERQARNLPGTIKVFGTPAEEVLTGKTFMIRDGAFDGVDAVLTWHPDDQNRVVNRTRLAAAALNVEFFGRSAHASASPWLGRSALSALMLFDHGLALMREHIRPTARIHRRITDGGAAANIIPDRSQGEYWVRDATGGSVDELVGRLKKVGEGVAMATETRVEFEWLFSTRDVLPNDALSRAVQQHLDRIGAPKFDTADVGFARQLQGELGVHPAGLATAVIPYGPANGGTASSDIGEVAAVVPLVELGVAVRPIGTPAHHWVQTSCAAHAIGRKGMLVAAKVLAATGVDLLASAATVKAIRDEFEAKTEGRAYVSPLEPGAKPRVP